MLIHLLKVFILHRWLKCDALLQSNETSLHLSGSSVGDGRAATIVEKLEGQLNLGK